MRRACMTGTVGRDSLGSASSQLTSSQDPPEPAPTNPILRLPPAGWSPSLRELHRLHGLLAPGREQLGTRALGTQGRDPGETRGRWGSMGQATGQDVDPDPDSARGAVPERYGSSAPLTLGVEEEFMLVHPGTYELVPAYGDVARGASGHDVHVTPEVTQSVVEAVSPVCCDVNHVEQSLRHHRDVLALAAERAGCRLAAAGTHPYCWTELERVSDGAHYRRLMTDFPWVAQESVTYGMHVHVGMPSTRAAIAVMNGLRPLLPVLLALGANSPFWKGRATGLASVRTPLAGLYPRSGVAPRFTSWAEYEQTLRALHVADGSTPDPARVWWMIRPAPHHGTIEVRAFDTQTDVAEAVALTALTQALCERLLHEDPRLATVLADGPDVVLEENLWAAARSGSHAEFVDVQRARRVPLREVVEDLLEVVAAPMAQLGSSHCLSIIETMAVRNGAARQLDRHSEEDDLQAVMRQLVRRTRSGADAPSESESVESAPVPALAALAR